MLLDKESTVYNTPHEQKSLVYRLSGTMKMDYILIHVLIAFTGLLIGIEAGMT